MNQQRDVLRYFISLINDPQPVTVSEETVRENYPQLNELLTTCSSSYYTDGTSLLTDGEYDSLLNLLYSYEKMVPSLKTKESITNKIEASINLRSNDVRYPHSTPMLSLDKVYTEVDLQTWLRKIHKKLDADHVIAISDKVDGVAIKLIYEKDSDNEFAILRHALLRGDGKEGIDVISHIKKVYRDSGKIDDIPMIIQVTPPTDIWWEGYTTDKIVTPDYLEITGELHFTQEALKEINNLITNGSLPDNNEVVTKVKLKRPNAPYKSIRHAVAAHVNMRHFYNLRCVIHGINHCYSIDKRGNKEEYFDDQHEALTWLQATCGLNTISQELVRVKNKKNNSDDVIERVRLMITNRNTRNREIDGVVISLVSFKQQKVLGKTRKYPKWALAFKFEPSQATSTLLSVDWQVGRTGKITPVASFNPVRINKVWYSQASLYNYSKVITMDLRNSDMIIIKRSGDVIPVVAGVVESARLPGVRAVSIPKNCPSCKSVLVTSEKNLQCVNPLCPAILMGMFEYVISRKVFDIKFLRNRTYIILLLIKKLKISHPEDVFKIDLKMLKSVALRPDGLPDEEWTKRLDKFLSDINEAKKNINTRTILLALNIPNVSESFIDKFLSMYHGSELPNIVPIDPNKTISSVTMEVFKKYLDQIDMRNTIFRLRKLQSSTLEVDVLGPEDCI